MIHGVCWAWATASTRGDVAVGYSEISPGLEVACNIRGDTLFLALLFLLSQALLSQTNQLYFLISLIEILLHCSILLSYAVLYYLERWSLSNACTANTQKLLTTSASC